MFNGEMTDLLCTESFSVFHFFYVFKVRGKVKQKTCGRNCTFAWFIAKARAQKGQIRSTSIATVDFASEELCMKML